MAAATIVLTAASSRIPIDRPAAARMNENSPIWASATATETAVRSGWPSIRTIASAASGLPSRITARVAATTPGERVRWCGSNSIPTETKNSTAKASRIGRASVAARRLNSDRPTTIPARKAPSAIETPNALAEPTAMPSASTSTVRVKSSRERVAAARASTQGISRPPP